MVRAKVCNTSITSSKSGWRLLYNLRTSCFRGFYLSERVYIWKSSRTGRKPSVARDIARVLGCHKNISGAIEGSNYIVTWALGHLVTLADPEEYDKKFKAWDMSYLPMVPKKWGARRDQTDIKQYHNVKTQLFRKDVSEIIIATDART